MERVKKFSIGKKTFTVEFPNVGQIIDIESLKQALTDNRYGAMAASGVATMYYALDIVDAVAFFRVCIPEVAKYYEIKNYTALAPEKVTEIVTIYKTEIKPWIDSVFKEIKETIENEEKNGKSNEE